MSKSRIGVAIGMSFVTLLCVSLSNRVQAAERGQTLQGLAYVSGGIGLEERAQLDHERAGFSLWVRTAAKGTGEYLSRVNVKITDASGKAVLDTTLDGPWLLVNLQRGRYVVEMTYNNHTQRRTTTIHAGDRNQLVFYYDVKP